MKSIAYEIINKAVCKMTRRVIEPDADDICPANVGTQKKVKLYFFIQISATIMSQLYSYFRSKQRIM